MAKRGVNKVVVMGNICNDLGLRFMPNGKAALQVTVATSETWKDKQTGEQKEVSEFHRCVVFDKRAEVIAQYFRKGNRIYIEGRLKTRKYQDNNGVDRYVTEVVIEDFQFVDKLEQSNNAPQQQPPQQQRQAPPQQQAPQQNDGFPDDFDDDIPF